jgi:hypothetical protein
VAIFRAKSAEFAVINGDLWMIPVNTVTNADGIYANVVITHPNLGMVQIQVLQVTLQHSFTVYLKHKQAHPFLDFRQL